MSALPENHDMRHESLEEEEKRLGPDHTPLPAWLDVKKQVRGCYSRRLNDYH